MNDIGDLLGRAQTLASEAEERIADLRKQREQIDGQIKTLERFARVISPPAPPTPKRSRVKKTTGRFPGGVNPDRVRRVAEAVTRNWPSDGQAFTIPELAKAMGLSAESVRRPVELLHKQEFLRLAGVGGKGGRAKLYAVMDSSRLEHVDE